MNLNSLSEFLKKSLFTVSVLVVLSACGASGTETVTKNGNVPTTGSCSAGPSSMAGNIFLENPRQASSIGTLSFTANLTSYITNNTIDSLDGTCLLESDHYRIVSDSLFPSKVAVTTDGFNFVPSDPRFQQVMAFHYANELKKNVLNANADLSALGMITIDAHCNVANNAFYSPNSKSLCFGYVNAGGGKKVWAADDADVIAHESGHSINHTLSSTSVLNSSGEAGAMDEAYADYWAYSVNSNSVISEWFLGALEFYNSITGVIRDASANHSYPNDMVYEFHDDSRVFSEALWDIRLGLGAAKADRLVSTSLSLLPATSRFHQGVQALEDAANLLGFSVAEKNLVAAKLNAKGLVRTDSAASLRISTNGAHKTVYVIDDHTLSAQTGGNCNGALDVGETAIILVNIENPTGSSMGMGAVSLAGVPAGVSVVSGGGSGEFFRMKPNSDFVDTLNSSGVYKEDATLAAAFLVTATSAGAKAFTMSFTPMGGSSVNLNFSLTVGSAATSSGCSNAALWP